MDELLLLEEIKSIVKKYIKPNYSVMITTGKANKSSVVIYGYDETTQFERCGTLGYSTLGMVEYMIIYMADTKMFITILNPGLKFYSLDLQDPTVDIETYIKTHINKI